MNKPTRKLLAGAGLLLVGLTTTAASCEQRGTRDAPIDTAKQDNQAPYIVNEPDGYMNFALKCAGKDMLVAHTRNGAPVVVPNASLCAPGVAEQAGVPRVGGYTPAS